MSRPMWFRVLALVIGFISCLTIIGLLWGLPLIFGAWNDEEVYLD